MTLGIVSVLYKWWAFYVAQIPEENWPVYFGPLAKLDTFVLGMLLALAVVAPGRRFRIAGAVPILLRATAVLTILVLFLVVSRSTLVALYAHTLSGLAFVLVLASTVLVSTPMRQSAWAQILASPGFQFLGLISYSMYIWHEPIMLGLTNNDILVNSVPSAFPQKALILSAVSVAVATLSYRAIERPAMRLRYLFTHEGRLANRYPG